METFVMDQAFVAYFKFELVAKTWACPRFLFLVPFQL